MKRPRVKPQIVLVDDDRHVLESLQRMLRPFDKQWEIRAFDCPRTALEHLRTAGAGTVISDLRMPFIDGLQLLSLLQESPQTKDIPFVILTGQSDRDLRRRALELGATDLLNKPADPDDVIARIRSSLRLKSYQDELKQHNSILEQRVRERTQALAESRLEVIWRLAKASEFRDEDTGNHVMRVASYCRAIAEQMGCAQEFVERLFLTAPLHDIGKIAIPDAILLKPGKLTAEEWDVMRSHAETGAKILLDDSKARRIFRQFEHGDAPLGGRDPLIEMAGNIARTHHEKWDGSGYPRGLRGEEIPLEARIVAVADVYDALTSARPYKQPFTAEKSASIILEGSGKHFDPAVAAAFEACFDEIRSIQSELADRRSEEASHEPCAVC
jgi:putative two-component system response regulator